MGLAPTLTFKDVTQKDGKDNGVLITKPINAFMLSERDIEMLKNMPELTNTQNDLFVMLMGKEMFGAYPLFKKAIDIDPFLYSKCYPYMPAINPAVLSPSDEKIMRPFIEYLTKLIEEYQLNDVYGMHQNTVDFFKKDRVNKDRQTVPGSNNIGLKHYNQYDDDGGEQALIFLRELFGCMYIQDALNDHIKGASGNILKTHNLLETPLIQKKVSEVSTKFANQGEKKMFKAPHRMDTKRGIDMFYTIYDKKSGLLEIYPIDAKFRVVTGQDFKYENMEEFKDVFEANKGLIKDFLIAKMNIVPDVITVGSKISIVEIEQKDISEFVKQKLTT